MSVNGVSQVVSKFNRVPDAVQRRIIEKLMQGAELVLADMKMLTPFDAENPGAHARDGLTIRTTKNGLRVHVGLPGARLKSAFFWFRFLDGGTQGGQVTYWRRVSPTQKIRATMNVPARPALRIREAAMAGNIDEIRKLVAEAVRQGLREA